VRRGVELAAAAHAVGRGSCRTSDPDRRARRQRPPGRIQPAGPRVHGRVGVPGQSVGDHRREPVPAPQVLGPVRLERRRSTDRARWRRGGRVHRHAVRHQRVRGARHGTGVRSRSADR